MNKVKLSILMATYNGEKFLQKQLDSIANQSFKNWDLWISDDGSSDHTLEILKKFRERMSAKNPVHLLKGPMRGSDINFWSLILNKNINADFFAFSDQDDEWEPNKLEIGIKKISKFKDPFLLFCSRTKIIDMNGNSMGFSPAFKNSPSMRNALVQSIAGGNTMIFCKNLREELTNISLNNEIVAHDWLIYQIICGLGGRVYYDLDPLVKYRQHENNLIGSNQSFYARIIRVWKLLNGSFKKWNESNLKILNTIKHRFKKECQEEITHFNNLRVNYMYKIKHIFDIRVYRQTIAGNIALFISIYINKI
tara:strand:+ start:170 stop:1093 length:924 start_codon:yes stop_codon:yes gene_type:complete